MPRKDRVIDPDELIRACEDSMFGLGNAGFCINCGYERGGCEPDAREYPCDECETNTVYGAQELLIMGYADE